MLITTIINGLLLTSSIKYPEDIANIFNHKIELLKLYSNIQVATIVCLIISSVIFEATIINIVFLLCFVTIIYSGVALLGTFHIVNGQRFQLEQKLETMEMYKTLLVGRSLTVVEVDLNEDSIEFYLHDKLSLVEYIYR